MTLIIEFEFFIANVNQSALDNQNQSETDRIIVLVTRTLEVYFRNKKLSNISAS